MEFGVENICSTRTTGRGRRRKSPWIGPHKTKKTATERRRVHVAAQGKPLPERAVEVGGRCHHFDAVLGLCGLNDRELYIHFCVIWETGEQVRKTSSWLYEGHPGTNQW